MKPNLSPSTASVLVKSRLNPDSSDRKVEPAASIAVVQADVASSESTGQSVPSSNSLFLKSLHWEWMNVDVLWSLEIPRYIVCAAMTAGDQGHCVSAVLRTVTEARIKQVTRASAHWSVCVYSVLVVDPRQLTCSITSAVGRAPNRTLVPEEDDDNTLLFMQVENC